MDKEKNMVIDKNRLEKCLAWSMWRINYNLERARRCGKNLEALGAQNSEALSRQEWNLWLQILRFSSQQYMKDMEGFIHKFDLWDPACLSG